MAIHQPCPDPIPERFSAGRRNFPRWPFATGKFLSFSGRQGMNTARQGDRSQPRLPVVAGLVAAFVTAGAVSWATPDGNLVVTLAPAFIVGLVVYGLALWRLRRGKAK